MRIICISDTHLRHDNLEVPPGDVLIHAGDSTMTGGLEEIVSFNSWLGTLPHKDKIVIAGNHDILFETNPKLAQSRITNAIYLFDCAATIRGVKFYGSPWQPWYLDWAFNLRRGAALKEKWDMIDADTDVLITHGPPYGILDVVPRDTPEGYEHTGCEELLIATERIKPRLHIFGHIHEDYGLLRKSKTTFANACICDSAYHPVNKPLVLELDEKLIKARGRESGR